MKSYQLLILLCIWILTTSTDCGREEYDQKRSVIYVKGQFSNTNDTMFVGDTLTLTITIPDSSFKLNELSLHDTTWIKIETFETSAFGYSFFRIDSTQDGGVDGINAYAETIFTIGNINMPYQTKYPFRHQIKKVLKMKGSYFFQSAYDEIPKINGIYGSMIIEWVVPNKNFEILRAWGNNRYESAKAADQVDANNYFPFVVKER